MRGTIHPLPPYTFMAWCSVEALGQLYLYLTFYHMTKLFWESQRMNYNVQDTVYKTQLRKGLEDRNF
jgi:hypothetical protein